MTENAAIEFMKRYLDIECYTDKCVSAHTIAIKALEEIQQYRAIGTPEEYRAANEKQTAKRVKNSGERIPFEWYCPACGNVLCDDGYKDTEITFCENCGQKLDWSDEE